MGTAALTSVPGLTARDALSMAGLQQPKMNGTDPAKAKATAQDFEAVFLNTMFEHMFTGLDGDGPFGGQGATGVWRSFLTDEYAKGFAKAGGIGIADQVYKAMLARQGGQS
jgi:Rod binding domain-containing protein